MEGGLHSSSRARTLAVTRIRSLGKICRFWRQLSENRHARPWRVNANFRRSRMPRNEDGVQIIFSFFFQRDEVPYFRCIGIQIPAKNKLFVDKLHSLALA
jgi:hypothetical protein